MLWALEELNLSTGLEYNLKCYKRLRGRAPEDLKQIFPLGKSPILEIPQPGVFQPLSFVPEENENPATKSVITEARLILQLLSDKYSNGEWVPETVEDRDRDTYFQEYANASLSGVMTSVLYFEVVPPNAPWLVRPLLYAIFNPIAKMFRNGCDPNFSFMERALSDDKPWFSGAKIGLADFNLSFPMDMASQRGYFDEKKYPKLDDWLKRVHQRPAYQSALKKGGSYDLVRFDM